MAQVFTGARALVKINQKYVGFVSGVNVTVEDTLTDVDVLGQLEVGDLAETAHKCNFTVNYFKPVSENSQSSAPDASSFMAHNNATVDNITHAALLGIDSSFTGTKETVEDGKISNMRSQAYFDCEIVDDITNKTIFIMKNCKYQGGSGQCDSRGLWTGSWSFKAQKGFGC